MNYYGPRQRESDKKWDYTCKNDDKVWPVGYCRAWYDLAASPTTDINNTTMDDSVKNLQFKDKHHTHGHDTAQEACECYREYLLDQRLFLNREYAGVKFQCLVCGEWTGLHARVDHVNYCLCKEHNNRQEVEKLFGAPGEIISSW